LLDVLRELVDAAPSDCYAEARWVHVRTEELVLRNGELERLDDVSSEGVGVRVLRRSGGGFGFAATRDLSAAGLRGALARALAVADGGALAPPAALAPLSGPPAQGHWEGPCAEDPFAAGLEAKLDLLARADAALRGDARIVRREASCLSQRTRWAFASTDGAAATQTFTQCGGGIQALAVGEDEVQVRSYPSAHGGSVAAAGLEHLRGLELAAHAPRVAEEAVALLTATPCPAGRTSLVLGSEQLALQIHESIGHALELDRIQHGEASYAGTSWVSESDLGTLRYGSPVLAITADATVAGGLGSFGWDDEGVAATRTPLIRDGVLRGALSDRVSAARAGLEHSSGCARADGFARQPIVRMTNVSIEPGEAGTLEELIDGTGEGIYLETNRSWSIDDRRLHFQFATEVAREIRGGRLGPLLRNASYAGITPRFWGSLDAVCSAPVWRLHGLLNCGKGEPGQVAHVSHGAAPARFRDVDVGVA
jgi:TldD protein